MKSISPKTSRGGAVAERPPEPDYNERVRVMNAEEGEELKRMLTDSAGELAQLMQTSQFTELRGANVIREIGRQLELFTGRQKLTLPAFESLAPALHSHLPDARLEFAKFCLSQHQQHPEAITDARVAHGIWADARVQMELLPAGSHGPQEKHLSEPIKDFLSAVVKVKSEYIALARTLPIEKWEEFFVDSFLRETAPLAELRQKATALAQGRTRLA